MKKIKGFLAKLFLIFFLVPSAAWALDISPGTGISAGGGTSIVVPINISDLGAGIEADAIGFTINFDPDVLTFTSVDKSGTLLDPFSLVAGQINAPGVAKISGSLFGSTVNIASNGVLLNINFTVNATAFKNSSLAITDFLDDIAGATTTDANFTITGVTVAVNLTADPTGDVVAGQSVQLTAEVTVNDTPLVLTSTADVDISGNGTGTFGTKSIVDGNVVVDYTTAALVESVTVTATESLTGNDNDDSVTVNSIPGPATQLLKDSGDGQSGVVADTLNPFVVKLMDANNNPIEGETINFTGGSLSSASDTTDADGMASTTLTLSEIAGANTVTASYDTLSAIFSATGTPDAPAAFVKVSGDNQAATAGTDLDPFVVSIADQYGNAVSGMTVTFAVTSGGGSLSPATPATGADGQAQTVLTLGTVSGSDNNTVTASAAGLDDLTFTASANPDAASSFTVVSGTSQTGTVNTALDAFVVKIADQYGNAISGMTVTFAVTAGGGSLSALTPATDADGQAQTVLTLGTVSGTDNNTVTADATGLTTLTFTASAQPDTASKIVLASDKAKIASDGKGEAQLTATLYDQFDNKVSDTGTPIAFEVTGDGVANAGWTSESADTTAGVATITFTTTGLVPDPGTTSVTIKATNTDLGENNEDRVVVEIVNFSATPEYSNLATSGTLHSTDITAVGATSYTWSIVSGPGTLSATSGTTVTFTAATTVTNGTDGDETVIRVVDAADAQVSYEFTLKTYATVQVTAPTQAVGITHDGDITTYQITVTGGSGAYEYRVSNADGSVPMDLGPISVSETGLVTGQSVGTRSVYVWDSALGSPGTDDSFRAVTADIEVVNKIVVVPSSESVQSSGTQQYQASGGNGTYTWSVAPVSAGTITSAGLFTAAAVTVNMTDVIITATDATYTNLMGTADLAVYSKVTITNKPEEPPLIAPGEESDAFTVAGGDDSAYTWSVAGPVDVDGGTGASFIFQAPDSGAFAGEYTVTVTDGQEFADSFTVLVPMVLDPDHYNLVEGNQLQIDILGAPEGSGFTFIAYDLNGNEVVFSEEGGDVTGWGQITREGNVLTYTPDDIGTADEIAFTLEVISDDADLIDLDLDLVESGTYRVIPTGTYAGVVKNADTDAPIGGALVTLMAPRPESVVGAGSEKVTMTDAYSRYTDVDGNFEFDLPATGAIYQFMVSMDGYVTKLFTSADLADSSDVLISATAATPLYISGVVSPFESGDIVTLTIDGEVVGVRITDFQGAFNFDFETDPGASEYLLTAVSKNAYNEKIVSGPLPIGDANIDLNEGAAGSIRLIVEDDISYERTDDIFGSDLLVKITAQDSTGNPITDPQFPNGLVLTLPFNLGQVAPGAFESGDVAVYHAAGQVELLDGDGIIVPAEDIIAVDYIGNGQTGYVTFRVYSLSVFGIGTGSGALSDSSDDSVCFISSVAGGSGMHLPVGVLGLAGLVAGLLHWTGKKSNR